MSIASPIQVNNGVYRDAARVHASDDNPAVIPIGEYATQHQISIRVSADEGDSPASTGTLALYGVPLGSDTAEVITDEAGDPVVFDITAPSTFRVSGVWEEFQLVPTGVDGNYITDTCGWLD